MLCSAHSFLVHMQAPRQEHMNVAYKVLCYIKGSHIVAYYLVPTPILTFLHFVTLIWGVCPLTRWSLTGYLVTLGGSLISWKTKKQMTVS